jgi:hypothetical protein
MSDGKSFDDAIEVDHISEEYAWMLKNGSFGDFVGQALVQNGESFFDVISFQKPDGTRTQAYFRLRKFGDDDAA